MRRALSVILLILLAACSVGYVDNYSFDLWCGDALCSWELEQGTVKRVSTWHDADGGLLMDEPTTISQWVDIESSECLDIELLSTVEVEGDLILEIDFGDDGIVDVNVPVPVNRWQDLRLSVDNLGRRSDARFRIISETNRDVVVAHLAAFPGCSRNSGTWWTPEY